MPRAHKPQLFYFSQAARIYIQTAYSWQETTTRSTAQREQSDVASCPVFIFTFTTHILIYTLTIPSPPPVGALGHTQHRGYTTYSQNTDIEKNPNVLKTTNHNHQLTNNQHLKPLVCFTICRALTFCRDQRAFLEACPKPRPAQVTAAPQPPQTQQQTLTHTLTIACQGNWVIERCLLITPAAP